MVVTSVDRAVGLLRDVGPIVLAVSGGRDSMVLLELAAREARSAVATVATFDHATGEAAARAVELVRERARELGVPVTTARARTAGRNEAALREARWDFLRSVSVRHGARVATAHTRDDQVETVLMRIMRGAGARGLAGLAAPSPVVRPLLHVPRTEIARWAREMSVRWVEDPSNASRSYFRNRVRHDLLPALLRARPGFDEELIHLAERAAVIRRTLEGVVERLDLGVDREGVLNVASASLAGYDPTSLRMLWPAIAARARITLDRRGTERLARFTTDAATGARMQLSGGVDVTRGRDSFTLSAISHPAPEPAELTNGTKWGRWHFRVESSAHSSAGNGARPLSTALLDSRSGLRIRAWEPGDRMRAAGDATPRRVKRFLRDAGLVGPQRIGWPVVLAGDEIVWIPEVRRSDAATVRPGRPGALYVCDRIS
jgi:tRNA(Ile)-lysidine synthase